MGPAPSSSLCRLAACAAAAAAALLLLHSKNDRFVQGDSGTSRIWSRFGQFFGEATFRAKILAKSGQASKSWPSLAKRANLANLPNPAHLPKSTQPWFSSTPISSLSSEAPCYVAMLSSSLNRTSSDGVPRLGRRRQFVATFGTDFLPRPRCQMGLSSTICFGDCSR